MPYRVPGNKKLLILTGMHRSATSLVASVLMECGVGLGNNLMKPDIGNPKGYFENQTIVDVNNSVLKRNQSPYLFSGKIKRIKYIMEDIYKLEKELAELLENSKEQVVLIKDPRISMLLDEWGKVVSGNVIFVFLIRAPFRVVDSLLRRGTDDSIKGNPFLALNSWYWYNKTIREFINRAEFKSHLIMADNFINDPASTFSKLREAGVVECTEKEYEKRYEDGLFKFTTHHFCSIGKLVIFHPVVTLRSILLFLTLKRLSIK